jgi:hypothetical protein
MRSAWQTVQCALGVLLRVLLLVLLVLVVAQDLTRLRERRRGIESGLAPAQPTLAPLRTGINVSLQRYGTNLELLQALETLREMGYSTLVQQFRWAALEPERGSYRWNAWDYTLDMVHEQGFSVVAVLDAAPAWARAPGEAGNPQAPPADPQEYARFAGAFATRYGDRVQAYQIWDRPNIHPHWGGGEIDPAGYVALLQAASTAIRGADPDGVIVAGNMAPTVERSGRNMSDVQFLREIYRRGASQWFDVLGAKALAFGLGPMTGVWMPACSTFLASFFCARRWSGVATGTSPSGLWKAGGRRCPRIGKVTPHPWETTGLPCRPPACEMPLSACSANGPG